MFALLYLPRGEYVYDGIKSNGNNLVRLEFKTKQEAERVLTNRGRQIIDFSTVASPYDNVFVVWSSNESNYHEYVIAAIIKQKHLFEVVKI